MAPRYLIKAKAPADGRHKHSGLFFVGGTAETDDPDQVTYARAQGWELTRLPDPEPELEPGEPEPTPAVPPSGEEGNGESSETKSDQSPEQEDQDPPKNGRSRR